MIITALGIHIPKHDIVAITLNREKQLCGFFFVCFFVPEFLCLMMLISSGFFFNITTTKPGLKAYWCCAIYPNDGRLLWVG